MTDELRRYLYKLHPALDVRGQWACKGNPKAAQKSIARSLEDRVILRHRGTRNYDKVWRHLFAPRLDDVFMFTIVRNPWDRVASAFFFLQQRGTIDGRWSFRKYVTGVLDVWGVTANEHFRAQAPSVLFQGRPIPGMFVGRFERLAEDWKYIATQLDLPQRLPHRNASKHEHYTTHYDDETIEIVRSLYQTEIKALGYEFGQ